MSEIAVQGCVFEASISELDGSLVTYTIQPPSPSNNIEVDSKGIYSGEISVVIALGATATLTAYPALAGWAVSPTASPTTVKINGTASNVLEDGKKCVQKGDSGKGSLFFPVANSTTGVTETAEVEVTVEVKNAGQTVVIVT